MTEKLMGGLKPQQRMIRNFALIMCLFVLAGCSSFKVAYTFADDLLEGRAEDYLDLNADDSDILDAQMSQMIAWHKTEMLPQYAQFFQEQSDIADQNAWTRAGVAQMFVEFRHLLDETLEGAAPYVAEVLVLHTSPEKIEYLEARMAENTAELKEEELSESLEETIDEWVERRVSNFERFIGPLTDAQLAIVKLQAETAVDPQKRWLTNRTLRQKALVTFMRSEPSADEIAEFVHQILLHAHEIVDPEYKAETERRWALLEQLHYDILVTLTDEQRRELVFNLRSYASDMLELSQTS